MTDDKRIKVQLNTFCPVGGCPYFEFEHESRYFEGWGASGRIEVTIYSRCKNIEVCAHAYNLAVKATEKIYLKE